MRYNSLTVQIFNGRSTTPRPDLSGELEYAQIERFETFFPGGLYGSLQMFVPRNVTLPPVWRGGDRIVVWNGSDVVWEGEISFVGYAISNSMEGNTLTAVGYWGSILSKRTIDKRWADNRMSDDVWRIDTTTTLDSIRIDRTNRMRFTPTDEEYPDATTVGALSYTMPTGETIKRITFNYDFAETAVWLPAGCQNNALTDLDNIIDGLTTTTQTVSLVAGQYFYIGARRPYSLVRFDFGGTVNSVAATMTVQYFDGTNWVSLTVTDGTASAGRTWARDGDMSWTIPDDWDEETSIGGQRMHWVRMTPSSSLTANVVIIGASVGELQTWSLRLRDRTGNTTLWSVTASGTGSVDHTLVTPRQALYVEFLSLARQRGHGNGTVYGQVSSMMVYSETGNITPTAVAQDAIDNLSGVLSSDAQYLGSNTLAVVPFITDGFENWASVLTRVLDYGDSSYNAWYGRLLHSESGSTANGRPVLQIAQYPALTDYDYALRLDDDNLLGPVEIQVDYDRIVNWVVVTYQDEDGRTRVMTPDDDANLKDTTSITLYGERHVAAPLDIGQGLSATAVSYGRSYLAAHKDPLVSITSPIRVMGFIRGKGAGQEIPTANIQAGNRLRVESFLDDVLGDGFTAVVTHTQYQDEICTISLGAPDFMALLN
jgi:hypothetical protein